MSRRSRRAGAAARVLTTAVGFLAGACGPGSGPPEAGGLPPEAAVALEADRRVPAEHAAGRALFVEHCAACHGPAATGTDQGPPLVHRIYEPSHHADPAFVLAATRGVRAHHWGFGDMPPVEGITAAEVEPIVGYVRWLQRQAGIE